MMLRAMEISACAILVAAVELFVVASGEASILVVKDYTFDNNLLPEGFTAVGTGTPTFQNGSLSLDGTAAIEVATPLKAIDNFGIEAVVTASSFDAFNFVVSNHNGANKGVGLLSEGTDWHAILQQAGDFGAVAATPQTPVHLALVRDSGITSLYVEGSLKATSNAVPACGETDLSTFSIGANRNNTGALEGLFKGSMDEVRLFTFAAGQFNPSTDLLTAVPEPSSVALAITGLFGLLAYAWRKRK
jgi:hypothetical protein